MAELIKNRSGVVQIGRFQQELSTVPGETEI